MDVFSSGVSLVVYFLAAIVSVAFLAFAIEELTRLIRRKEHKRMQKKAWQQEENWAGNSPGQGHAHK